MDVFLGGNLRDSRVPSFSGSGGDAWILGGSSLLGTSPGTGDNNDHHGEKTTYKSWDDPPSTGWFLDCYQKTWSNLSHNFGKIRSVATK